MDGLRGGIMTRFEKIQKMSVDEMAKFFVTNSSPDLPHSACYICKYDNGMWCEAPDDFNCTYEYKTELYKKWLNQKIKN